jgi:hypothetical protein
LIREGGQLTARLDDTFGELQAGDQQWSCRKTTTKKLEKGMSRVH